MIVAAEDRYGPAIDKVCRRYGLPIPPAYLWAAIVDDPANPLQPVQGHTDKPTAHIHVNAGRWLATCPLCGNLQHAAAGDVFYCSVCNNRDAGHRTIPQKWPVNADKIAEQLDLRPHQDFKHWHRGETIADLKRQDMEAMRSGVAHAHLLGRT